MWAPKRSLLGSTLGFVLSGERLLLTLRDSQAWHNVHMCMHTHAHNAFLTRVHDICTCLTCPHTSVLPGHVAHSNPSVWGCYWGSPGDCWRQMLQRLLPIWRGPDSPLQVAIGNRNVEAEYESTRPLTQALDSIAAAACMAFGHTAGCSYAPAKDSLLFLNPE